MDAASATDDWMIFSDPVAALSSPIVATYISSYHTQLKMGLINARQFITDMICNLL